MKKQILLGLALGFASLAHANSFVGNGGSEGDVELAVSKMQIREAMQVIQKKDPTEAEFCACNRMYQGRAVCEPLRALNETQQKFCSQTLYKEAEQVAKVVKDEDSVRVVWTNSPIDVVEGSKHRAADAVANRERREITVNLPRFLAMQPAERVFLLTHEYLHFTQIDGKPVTDEGAVGPFSGEDGSRTLVNAMASATAVLQGAYPRELKSYSGKLSRSQAWKSRWFSGDIGSAGTAGGNYSDNFAFNNYVRGQLAARYQFTNEWGIVGAWRNESQKKTLTYNSMDIDTKEEANIFGLGVAYRIFFNSDPLTFWGQSHLVVQGMVESVKTSYNYGDRYNSFSDSASIWGGSLAADYYLPLWWGFWGYVGVAYEYHPYKYTDPTAQLNLNYDKNILSGYMGVSYAF
jgi:hypothetical protein